MRGHAALAPALATLAPAPHRARDTTEPASRASACWPNQPLRLTSPFPPALASHVVRAGHTTPGARARTCASDPAADTSHARTTLIALARLRLAPHRLTLATPPWPHAPRPSPWPRPMKLASYRARARARARDGRIYLYLLRHFLSRSRPALAPPPRPPSDRHTTPPAHAKHTHTPHAPRPQPSAKDSDAKDSAACENEHEHAHEAAAAAASSAPIRRACRSQPPQPPALLCASVCMYAVCAGQ